MKKVKKTLSLILTLCMLLGSISITAFAEEQQADESKPMTENSTLSENEADEKVIAEQNTEEGEPVVQSIDAVDGYEYSIVMVDCGRKYYSVDSLKSIINSASDAGMHYVMLGIGNDGLRFLLNDMSLEVNGTSYTSEQISEGIHKGNENYSNFEVDELTESDMNTILKYASTKGVEIIPLINSPGHMDAIIDCMESIGMKNVAYKTSNRTIDVTSDNATAFTQALVQKYITYFASKGCTMFNIGADEYGNDINNTPQFSALISNNGYGKYITYLNTLARQIKAAGMTPMAFNDGIYYNSQTGYGTIDSDIVVCYWSSGWNGYNVTSAEFLSEQGFDLVNTHGDYYWIVGGKKVTEASARNFKFQTFSGNTTITSPVGAMFCIWGDNPQAQTDTLVANEVASVISAFGSTLPETETRTSHKDVIDDSTDVAPAPDPAPDVTPDTENQEEIILEMGASVTRKQENVNNKDNVDTTNYDESIATVTVDGEDAVEAETSYTKTSVQLSSIATQTQWAKTEYFYKTGNNYYPVYAYKQSSYAIDTRYYYGYSKTDNANDVTEISNNGWWENKSVDLYKQSYTPATSASTEITFTGVMPGTTNYKVGEITYKITVKSIEKTENRTLIVGNSDQLNVAVPNGGSISYSVTEGSEYVTVGQNGTVTAGSSVGNAVVIATVKTAAGNLYGTYTYNYTIQSQDLNNVEPIEIEYWITNARLTAADGNQSLKISASDNQVATQEGVLIKDLIALTAAKDERNQEYWQSKILDVTKTNSSTSGTELQTTKAGDDETLNGTTFSKVRYWNGAWQVYTTQWTNIDLTQTNVTYRNNSNKNETYNGNKNQLVAYYMEVIDIKNTNGESELHVNAADWGIKGDGTGNWGYTPESNRCSVSIQVVYEDSTTNPANTTADALKSKTFVYGYWDGGRGLGTMIFDGNQNYQIYRVSAETGTMTSKASGNYVTVTNFSWAQNEETVWEGDAQDSVSIGNPTRNPSYESPYDNLAWNTGSYNKNNAILIRVYVRAKQTEDSLQVHYVDQTTQTDFYNYNIIVNSGTLFDERFAKSGTGLIYNTVVNKNGASQVVQSDLKNMTEIGAQYRYGNYTFVSVKRSDDGKEVWLYYTFDNTHEFVADFGLPLEITVKDLGLEDTSWTSASVGNAKYGTVSQNSETKTLTYVPTKTLQDVERFTLTLTGTDNEGNESSATHMIYIYPATTVYYEETFFTLEEGSAWSTVGNAGNHVQTTSKVGEKANYGYDASYASETSNSNGTAIESSKQGDKANFTFTGTGFDLNVNCDKNSGYLLVKVTNKSGTTEKFMLVNTASINGESDLTIYPQGDLYNVPVISCTDLAYGEHTVTVTHADSKTVTLDGYRVYNTLLSQSEEEPTYSVYKQDLEENPTFIEVRNLNFGAINLSEASEKYASDIYEQVYSQIQNTENCNAVISSREEDEINASTDLIDNGPKNEIYLYSGMSLTLNLNSNREVQIGLRGLQNKMTCRIGDTNQEVSTTDMFYIIKENGNIGTVTITNPSDSNTILAVSKLKVSDSIDSLETISEENILDMLHTMGYKEPVPMAEAFANINLVDYTGAVIASTSLTANGEQGTDAAFTADTLKYAAESVLPEGYAIVDAASIVDRTVKYGESADVNVQIGKVATLQVTYKKLFGKTVGTATLIGVQTSAEESYSFSASEIKKAVPDGYWTVKLFGTKVEYGTTSKLTVNVF